jgi:hypothetical protein
MWGYKEEKNEKDMIIISKDELMNLKNQLSDKKCNKDLWDSYTKNQIIEGQLEIIDKIIEVGSLEIKKIKNNTYISLSSKPTDPYIESVSLNIDKQWNPNFPQDSICECGHTYDRHFDSYEDMDAIGCKYCQCYDFKLKI